MNCYLLHENRVKQKQIETEIFTLAQSLLKCLNFRKKSLSCHPDKHPDDPNAVEIFVQLCQAQKLLLEQFECQNNSIFDDLFDEQNSNVAPQWTSNSTAQSQNASVRI